MTHVKFTVIGQRLKRITFPYLVRDSKNHIHLDFEFMTKDWKECKKKAIFDGKYEVDLVDDSVIVPVTQSIAPEFTVSVYGVNGDKLITTNDLVIQLNESGYVEGAVEPPEIALEEYKKQVAELEADLAELQASIKPEQEKSIDIIENGTTEITPDENKTLSKVTVNVDVPSSGDTAELENLIDESGVLDSTDGTATEKVEKLIEKAEIYKFLMYESRLIRFKANQNVVETPILDCINITSMHESFNGMDNLKTVHLRNTQTVTSWGGTFYSDKNLETVETLDFSSATQISNPFVNCYSLVYIKIVEETIKLSISFAQSPLLSDESIQSIIDGLATVETTQKLTLHTDIVLKLTEEQYNTIYEKKWDIG